jgi:hypothetical protein
MKSTDPCVGCRDNFYNAGQNQLGVMQCWKLPAAKLVRRWRQYWWTNGDVPGAFVEVDITSRDDSHSSKSCRNSQSIP